MIWSDKDKCAARARVEQAKAGPGGNKVRARLVDIGRGDLFDAAKVKKIPEDLKNLPILCQRYKMADLKPKGRDEGFSAQDREKGAEWLRGLVSRFGPVIKASCHQIVNYKGGIMFDGEIGGKNINQLALMQGLAVPNPNIMNPKQPAYMMATSRGPGFGPIHRQVPVQMSHPHEWDADYLEYGSHHPRPPMMNNQQRPAQLRRPNQGLPVPGGYNPVKIPDPVTKSTNKKGNQNGGGDVQKLKATVQTLEGSLSKKNKEISELKKAKNQDEQENNYQKLSEIVARVSTLRRSYNPKEDSDVREKVADTARLVRDVHQSLTLLGKKSSDADKAVAMYSQCQEQMLSIEDSKPLEPTLAGAKQAVSNYTNTYIEEFNELRSHLDDGCEVLQQVLDNDVPGPQVKLNVGQLEAQKRKEIVEVAAQMADQWAKEDRKEAARLKADEALSNLLDGITFLKSIKMPHFTFFTFLGLSETAGHLRGAASSSQGLPAAQRQPLPNLNSLAKKATNCYSLELGLLSPPGSAAAESLSKTTGVNYASVMATLAKAITICLAEKSVAEEKFQKYNEIVSTY